MMDRASKINLNQIRKNLKFYRMAIDRLSELHLPWGSYARKSIVHVMAKSCQDIEYLLDLVDALVPFVELVKQRQFYNRKMINSKIEKMLSQLPKRFHD